MSKRSKLSSSQKSLLDEFNNLIRSSECIKRCSLKFNSNVEQLLAEKNGISLIQYLGNVGTVLYNTVVTSLTRGISANLNISSLEDEVYINFNIRSVDLDIGVKSQLDRDFSLCPNYYLVFSKADNYMLALSFLTRGNASSVKSFFRDEVISLYKRIYRGLHYIEPTIKDMDKAEFYHDLSIARKYFIVADKYSKTKLMRIEKNNCINPMAFGVHTKSYLYTYKVRCRI